MFHHPPFVVAIDGPAASGKGTIARAISRKFGFRYLDTGLLYRTVSAGLQRSGLEDFSVDQAVAMVREIPEEVHEAPQLRTLEVTRMAPLVAAIPEVRAALVAFQRRFARAEGGAVLDGRDIGTVICPEAEVKLYVTASDTERARRRWLELGGESAPLTQEQMLEDLRARDARDASRATAPLKPAPDAVLLDTSDMSIDEAVSRAISVVAARLEAMSG